MEYVLIKFRPIYPNQVDMVIADLSENNFDGFEEGEGELKAYIPKELFNDNIIDIVSKHGIAYTKEIIFETNWNEEWEKNFEPVLIPDYQGNKNYCFIRASFHKSEDALHEIIITPKMSFGTGHHATTYMMVQQMSRLDFKNKSVVDFGTGTGILAILAEKLGAASIVANDYDTWCIENSKENLIINNCEKTNLILSSKFPAGSFDIVLANINLNIIVENLQSIVDGCKESGFIILSGMLKENIPTISEKLKELQLNDIDILEKDNWISILLKK